MPVAEARGVTTLGEQQPDWKKDLADYIMAKVSLADRHEELRRRSDRVGANLFYGRHWNVAINNRRAALTANVTKSLIEHKISIMTKQEPLPVVVAGEAGDVRSARLMRNVLMRWWRDDGMQMKIRRAERIANATRTCALKACWNTVLHGGAGDVTVDIVPGWRLILDDRADFVQDMEFIGHREMMRRSASALCYPEAAKEIFRAEKGVSDLRNTPSSQTMPPSPIGSSFRTQLGGSLNFGTIVDGKPVISAFSNQPGPISDSNDMVQIIELHYRDDAYHEEEVTQRDEHGSARMEIARSPDGMPLFDEQASELIYDAQGGVMDLPTFKLRQQEVKKIELVRDYPWYRRTTIMLPDAIILDDRAWDGPVPYALVSDGDTLEGPWVRGCALDCEDMQVTLNVSLSLMMDNLRLSSMRPVLAGTASNLQPGNSLMISPGTVIGVGSVEAVKPLEFPQLSAAWFQWAEFIISLMERIIGAQGVMQGEAVGRMDSSAGVDSLAEIGGSRIVEATQRMEVAIQDIMRVVGWFAQKFYTERHAIAVEDKEGQPTFERVSGPFLYGTFDYQVSTGSTLAWSETAVRARLLQELQAGIIDKIAYWQRTNTPDWPQIRDRLLTQNPILSGPAAAPPPRTRTSSKTLTPGKGKG